MRPLRIFTWHVHGNYLYYLAHSSQEFYLPTRPDGQPGYGGKGNTFPWRGNVYDVPAEEVRHRDFDCVLFQSHKNYLEDQYEVLSDAQRRLPRVYLEHDPPRAHPTDTRHPVDEASVLVVHVTPFNALMWDCGKAPTRVIEHGVAVPQGVRYSGEIARGLVVINNLRTRGRRLGLDLFQRLKKHVPLDLVGLDSESLGGLGEVRPPDLPAFMARYRFLFNPIRYTSLGLAVCEAMVIGMPIIGLATTEMVTAVQNGRSGFLETDLVHLEAHMHRLLSDRDEAERLGTAARRYAARRFAISRFAADWDDTFTLVAGRSRARPLAHSRAGRPAL